MSSSTLCAGAFLWAALVGTLHLAAVYHPQALCAAARAAEARAAKDLAYRKRRWVEEEELRLRYYDSDTNRKDEGPGPEDDPDGDDPALSLSDGYRGEPDYPDFYEEWLDAQPGAWDVDGEF